MDEIKFHCAISSNVDVIDRMKVKFFPEKWHVKISCLVRYMCVKRRKASVLVTPVAVHEQWNSSVVWGKKLLVQ